MLRRHRYAVSSRRSRSAVCFFIFVDPFNLGGGTGVGIEGAAEVFLDHHLGDFDAGDLSADGDDVGVVAQLSALGLIHVVDNGSVSALDLVGGDHDADAGAAEEDAAVILAGGHGLGNFDSGVGVDGIVTAEIGAFVTEGFN